MAATMRRAVTSVTDVMFPVSKSHRDPQQRHLIKKGHEYVSNLPLQMSLYFNGFYFVFWLASMIVGLQAKYNALSVLYRIIIIAVLVVVFIVEVIRLYLGYLGNLTEKVPELAGFWLLTLVLQAPLTLFLLLNEAMYILPLERAVCIVQTAFILFEIIAGYLAIRAMVEHQVAKFHLQQFTNIEDLNPEHLGYVNNGYVHEHQS